MKTDERKRSGFHWFAAGALSACLFGVFAGTAFVLTAHGFSTRQEPSVAERWLARRARMAALPTGASTTENPVPDSAGVLAEASAHWADHCAVCHSNNGSGEAEMGKRLYPPAPDMRQAETQNLTDGELFYIIQNGIRLTGMPSWGSGTSRDEKDSWKLVRFIRHLPKLTTEEEKQMQAANPRSPGELREEEQERNFLNGDQPNENAPHQYH